MTGRLLPHIQGPNFIEEHSFLSSSRCNAPFLAILLAFACIPGVQKRFWCFIEDRDTYSHLLDLITGLALSKSCPWFGSFRPGRDSKPTVGGDDQRMGVRAAVMGGMNWTAYMTTNNRIQTRVSLLRCCVAVPVSSA
jgi:hypothetical protein